MKKLVIIGTLLTAVLFSANAQGLYFDIGLGIGGAWTRLDGSNVSDAMQLVGGNISEIGVDIGLKAGYGPVANIPLYIVGVLGGIGHRLWDDLDHLQFNSYLIGAGLIFYPIPLIQLAGSIGFSFVGNQSSLPYDMFGSTGGFAWDISAALDLGGGNHGALIGLRYFRARNTLEISRAVQLQHGLSVFVRYAFRHRM
jgi:hypothetical protein